MAVAVGAVLLTATPAGAHGIGGRADLPLPVWLFVYSAAFALLISFVALRILWPRPRLAAAAEGRPAPAVASTVASVGLNAAKLLTLGLFLVTVAASWFGVNSASANLAPTALYITFWVGMQIVSPILGDVWRSINPLYTLAAAFDRLGRRDPDRDTSTGIWATHWPAAAGLIAFLWLELAYFESASPVAVGVFLGVYSGLMLIGATWFGAGWIRTGDGFAVLFSLLGALAPLHWDDTGRLRLRMPGSGLSTVEAKPGTLGVILVILGGTTFDGLARTSMWDDVVSGRREWDLTLVNTVGLALTVATVSLAFLIASRAVALLAGDDDGTVRQAWRWVPSLIPIMLAYAVAHYFSLLVLDGQAFFSLLSDPFGQGWDLLGTADNVIAYTALTANQIAYVQVVAIVGGHVAGVTAAHDRAVELFDGRTATRSQYPMLAVMIAYTVGGLLLLLNA